MCSIALFSLSAARNLVRQVLWTLLKADDEQDELQTKIPPTNSSIGTAYSVSDWLVLVAFDVRKLTTRTKILFQEKRSSSGSNDSSAAVPVCASPPTSVGQDAAGDRDAGSSITTTLG
ncbi:hypothetical protein F2P81_009468 [Scophthalmus maximus]|uniref:Uncharacterized protein n=1 Tax=Scophthalmus maximus TaxID=52904 RepID=A0A6A4T718_SCOMX|nr:hypothetical protein F2P81_009468 [Scophthalmus maximus]